MSWKDIIKEEREWTQEEADAEHQRYAQEFFDAWEKVELHFESGSRINTQDEQAAKTYVIQKIAILEDFSKKLTAYIKELQWQAQGR